MDRTEKEPEDRIQSESSETEGTESYPQNSKLIQKDSAETKSDDLDSKDTDIQATTPDAKPLEALKPDQFQEQARQSHPASDENPDSVKSNMDAADSTDDVADKGENSDEIGTEADPSDSTETGRTDEKNGTAEHSPADLEPQPAGNPDEEKSGQTGMDEAAKGQGDAFSSDGDADRMDQQQGVPEEAASSQLAAGSQINADMVAGAGEPPFTDNDRPAVADEKESVSEHTDSKEQAVEGTEPAGESESSDEEEQDTENQEDADFESALHPPEATAPRTSIGKIVVSALMITALFSGFFIFENKSKIDKDPSVAEAPSEARAQAFKVGNKQFVDIPTEATPGIYDDSINEVSNLRETLLKKQAEVVALKKRYRQSIEELEKEILDEQRKADVQTFLQATNHNRIVFSLKTIQRRQAYIRQLEKPLKWVSGACEELLFLKRRVLTDLRVSTIASGIDMDRHVQQMHRALREYRPTADKLAIDPTDAQLESLETIWQRIQDKQDVVSAEPVYSKNEIISAQICNGDFNRMGELSEITAATAKCLMEMQASDLFLNQINEISPGAARQLCQWKGSWICMNGIKALSPRVAHYLFQWDGQWISLNGLTDFPAEIGEALLRWRGRQLELMGLLDTDDSHTQTGLEYLAEWERSGGKLFVPENLRQKIDALHQQSG
ncbi:MAG: hypothetical protein PVI58_10225 [Desulfobacterales bacterium]|jgi:hypothetical protein